MKCFHSCHGVRSVLLEQTGCYAAPTPDEPAFDESTMTLDGLTPGDLAADERAFDELGLDGLASIELLWMELVAHGGDIERGGEQVIGTAAHKPYLEAAPSEVAPTPAPDDDFLPVAQAPLVRLALGFRPESHLDVAIDWKKIPPRHPGFPLVGEGRYLMHSVIASKLGLASHRLGVMALASERRYLLHSVIASKLGLASHTMGVMPSTI